MDHGSLHDHISPKQLLLEPLLLDEYCLATKAHPYRQQKQKQNRNRFLILLKQGQNHPCRRTKTETETLCQLLISSNQIAPYVDNDNKNRCIMTVI